MKKRVIIIVIDSFGVGALPDAGKYGDEGANTALHICEQIPGNKWGVLRDMGLGNACANLGYILPGCEPVDNPTADYGVMAAKSPGKDTTTGHWELAGIILDTPFAKFPEQYPSFPNALVQEFTRRTGLEILGNKAASGTEIIKEFGVEHGKTGKPICYTSADSVFQIAANEAVIPVERLYEICRISREICDGYNVGRVIARPFITDADNEYVRTSRRKDYSIDLTGPTMLDKLQEYGVGTVGVGKIGDIFNEQGLSSSYHDKGNTACLERVNLLLQEIPENDELIFVNLVDTDMHYGHRRDPEGYCSCVETIDNTLTEIQNLMGVEDTLIITADHGCDPCFKGTDHTREYVPLLVYQKNHPGKSLGISDSYSHVSDAVLEIFLKRECGGERL